MKHSAACWHALLILTALAWQHVPAQDAEGFFLSVSENPESNEEQYNLQASQEAVAKEGRSLDIDEFKDVVPSTIYKISKPVMISLRPPKPRDISTKANLPLRFGRAMEETIERTQKAALNLSLRNGRSQPLSTFLQPQSNFPQRFGRTQPSATLPQRFGRSQSGKKPSHYIAIFPLRFGKSLLASRELQDQINGYQSVEETKEPEQRVK
ncbi:pro-FMRFamide-related neuropeptide VF [Polyodon spathula]|uniref:pro-FMRFamide-related neuropeptide VF n=1 Tax=Polyodon spathula TaxID=7913 RepID=UPI001B7F2ABF|nr:pro-FMRFamide-related neuropeptide VF [Polyodon spathula]